MDFTRIKSAFLQFFFLIVLVNLLLKISAKQIFENVIFGKCCSGRQDIIYITGTHHLCSRLCKERPVCRAFSHHRLSWICRLHTEECMPVPCVGAVFSKKEGWDMTHFNACACPEGQVCVQEGENTDFTCETRECILPPRPANGEILGNDVKIGRHILYDCEEGFVPEGELTRECLRNGTWSGANPRCDTVCPVGSYEWGQSCYIIVTNSSLQNTFAEASNYCEGRGGHMIHVTSQEEHEYIISQLVKPSNPTSVRYWIGVMRNNTDENWYLSDYTTPAVYESWAYQEPKDLNDCASYKYVETASLKWQWFSESCAENPRYPICEIDLTY